MRMILAALLIWMTSVCPGGAGAWLRDTDELFFSATSTLRISDEELLQENAIYLEYGLFPRLTVGVDYNHLVGYSGHALVFARLPLPVGKGKWKFAAEAAIGGHHWMGDWDPMLKTTLSAGRGIKTRQGHGWLAIDVAMERRYGTPAPLYKLDATLGLPGYGRIAPILQLETAKAKGHGLFWAVTPGIRYDLKKLGTLLIGFEKRHAVGDTRGLKFGLWKTF